MQEFDSPASPLTVRALSSPQQAFPNPFACGDASGLCGGFHSPPALVIHAEVAFWGLSGRWPANAFCRFFLGFHAYSIWAPRKFATLYFVCGQKGTETLECTHRLGVMAQQKTPRQPCRADAGREHKLAFARCVPSTCILSGSRKKGDTVTARRDFRIVRDKFANDSGLPFGRLLSPRVRVERA